MVNEKFVPKKGKVYPHISLGTSATNNWAISKELGDGSFGKVFLVTDKNGKSAALKRCLVTNDSEMNDMALEVYILRICECPYIIKCYEAHFSNSTMDMVIELCARALDDILMDTEVGLEEYFLKAVTRQTTLGLQYLHSKNIIHRDLKAGNILITEDGYAKLADFGVSALNKNKNERRKTFIGTPYWMAPEVIRCETSSDNPYDYSADIWSLGITLIELREVNPPHHDQNPNRVLLVILRSQPPRLENPDSSSIELNSFIEKCLIIQPDHRATADELLKHPYVNKPEALSLDPIKNLLKCVNGENVEEEIEEVDIDLDVDGSKLSNEIDKLSLNQSSKQNINDTKSSESNPGVKTIRKTRKFIVNGEVKTEVVVQTVNSDGVVDKSVLKKEHDLRKMALKELKQMRRTDAVELSNLVESQKNEYEHLEKISTNELNVLSEKQKSEAEFIEKSQIKELEKFEQNLAAEQKSTKKRLKAELEKETKQLKEIFKKCNKKSPAPDKVLELEHNQNLDKLKINYSKKMDDFVNISRSKWQEFYIQQIKSKHELLRKYEAEKWQYEIKSLLVKQDHSIRSKEELRALQYRQTHRQFAKEHELNAKLHKLHSEETNRKQILEKRDFIKKLRADHRQQMSDAKKAFKTSNLKSVTNEKEYLKHVEEAHNVQFEKEVENLTKKHSDDLANLNAKYKKELLEIKESHDEKIFNLLVSIEKKISEDEKLFKENYSKLIKVISHLKEMNEELLSKQCEELYNQEPDFLFKVGALS